MRTKDGRGGGSEIEGREERERVRERESEGERERERERGGGKRARKWRNRKKIEKALSKSWKENISTPLLWYCSCLHLHQKTPAWRPPSLTQTSQCPEQAEEIVARR